MSRARKRGLKLSKEKSQIKVKPFKYLGYNLSNESFSVNMKKIKGISDYTYLVHINSSNKSELQRFVGITYLGKSIANLSTKENIFVNC